MKQRRIMHLFDHFAGAATRHAGSPAAFVLAVLVVVIWALTGPIFGYSETWQLIINTGTTIITFLMVFLIQQSQNKDSMAVHLKLNELAGVEQAGEQSSDLDRGSRRGRTAPAGAVLSPSGRTGGQGGAGGVQPLPG